MYINILKKKSLLRSISREEKLKDFSNLQM